MNDLTTYNRSQDIAHREICNRLEELLTSGLPEATAKVWHGHPVWFIDENPIVGYSVQKAGVRLMFWSGKSFNEQLLVGTSNFMDASIFYKNPTEIDEIAIARWLEKARSIQWDYKNIVKRKGTLLPLKGIE